MKKSIVSVAAGLITLIMLLSACGGSGSSGASQAGSSGGGEKAITIAMVQYVSDRPNFDGTVFKAMEEMSNTKLTIELWPPDAASERRNALLASGDLPDWTNVTRAQAFLYGDDGMFVPLDDLIDQHAPNLKGRMTLENIAPLKNPKDGKIYNIPKYYTLSESTEWNFTYRKDILEELNEKEPETMDEWYDLFKKVQAWDPEIIPLCERSRDFTGFVHPIFDMGRIDGNFGVIGSEFTKGSREIVFLPITNEWRSMLEYYNKLYAEKLLDPEYLTIEYTTWWDTKIIGGRAFACFTQNFSRADNATDAAKAAGIDLTWWTAETPKNVKTGQRAQYKTANPWQDAGWALNAKSNNKQAAIEFVDWLYTPEAAGLLFYGLEGEHHTRGADGSYVRMQPFPENERLRQEQGWLFDMVAYTPVEMLSDLSRQATGDHFKKNPQHVVVLPTISRAGDTTEEYTAINAELGAFVNTSMDQLVTGQMNFNEWDAYVKTCKDVYKCDRGVEIVQEWFDTYFKMIGQ